MILIKEKDLLDILKISKKESANLIIKVDGLNIELSISYYYNELEQYDYLTGLKKDKEKFLDKVEKDITNIIKYTLDNTGFKLEEDTKVYIDFKVFKHTYDYSLNNFSLKKKPVSISNKVLKDS